MSHRKLSLSGNMSATMSESEGRKTSLKDSSYHLAGLMTPDGILKEVNESALFFSGLKHSDVVNKYFWETLWWAEAEELQKTLRESVDIAAGGNTVYFEATHTGSGGKLRYIDFSISPIKNSDGKVIFLIPEGHDITEQKEAEQELSLSEQKFRAIINNTYQFIALLTPEGTLIEVNESALAAAGLRKSEIINKPFWEAPWWAHSEELQNRLRDAISKSAKGEFFRYETHHISPDGNIYYLDFSLKPVMDKDGKVIYLLPEGRDITERKKAEQELELANKRLCEKIIEHEQLEERLHRSEEEYRMSFEASPDAVMLLGETGFYACNKATLNLFGFSAKEQFITKQLSDMFPPTQPDGRDSRKAAAEHVENAFRNGVEFFEWVYMRSDGTQFPAEVLLSRMEYQSKTVIQATVRDITERKKAEQALIKAHKIAEENAQQQGRIEMSNNMLHDIGNAMTGISAHALLPQLDKDWQELKSLRQLRDMFVSKEKELADILGVEKEKALISFMETLLLTLQKRNTDYVDFFKKISGTVGHINAVLDLQRHYARGARGNPFNCG